MKFFKLLFLFSPILSISQNKLTTTIEKQNNKYEYVYAFENNHAVFRTFANKMGVIDSKGNVVVTPIFSFIYNKKELKNLFEVGNKINKKFKRGFIDLRGNTKIPIIYDDVFYVEKDIIRVTKDNKFGVLDTLNNTILPIKFDYISFDNDIIITQIKEKKELYDFRGKQISNIAFTDISNFIDNKAIVTFQNKSTSIIDHTGNIILKTIKGFSFENVLNDEKYLIKNNLNEKKGVVNSKGDFMITCKYDAIKQVKSFFIATINDKQGFISSTDSIIKPFDYDEIYVSNFDNPIVLEHYKIGANCIVQKDNLYGVMNPYIKNDIIPLRYKNITTVFDKYYIVENTEGKNGLFLGNGANILNEEYKFYNTYENTIFASRNNKQFLIKLEDAGFSEKEVFVDTFVTFKGALGYRKNANQIFTSKGKFGIVNTKNMIIVPCEYESIEPIYDSNEFIVKKDNKYGVVNSANKIVEKIDYDAFNILKESIVFTKKNKAVKKHHQISYQ